MSIPKQPSWSTSQDTCHDDLQDVCLDDTKDLPPTPLPPGDRPEAIKNVLHECLFVAVIAFSAASSVFLQRSVVVIIAQLGQGLDMSPAELAWINAAPGLTTAAFLIPFGHLADVCSVLSRKTLLLLSLASFSLIVGLTSFSPTGVVMDVMSGLAGIACAANIPIAVGILSLLYPVSSRRKNIVFSSFLIGNPAATIAGGLSSGALTEHFSWKAPFYCLASLYAVLTILGWFLIPNDYIIVADRMKPSRQDRAMASFIIASTSPPKPSNILIQFDWFGLFLLLTGTVLFAVSLTIGPEGDQPWKTPTVILLLTLGLLSLGCFILWENVTKTPMIPPSIWANWTLAMVLLLTLSCAMAYYSSVFWISMFLQQVENLTPFNVAIRLLPQALMGIFFSPLVGLLLHKVPGTTLLLIATACSVASNVLLIFILPGSNYFLFLFPSLMLGTIGMDWTMNVGSLYILSALPLRHHSIGASLMQTTARLGIPLGLAVTTAVWSSYDDQGGMEHPEFAYAKTFVTTTAFAGFSLILAPFVHIGKQGDNSCSSYPDTRENKVPRQDRPSKRWSIVDAISDRSTASAGLGAQDRSFSIRAKTTEASQHRKPDLEKALPRLIPAEKVIWVVCEACGRNQRSAEDRFRKSGGDPAEYFNNIECGVPEKQSHDMIVNGRRRFPLVKHPNLNATRD